MVFLSTFVNLLALASSLWLGFYIITRSPRSHISWLAALTLWSLSSYFLHNSLAINLPASSVLPGLRTLVLFVVPLWLHLSLELISVGASPPQHPLSPTLTRVGMVLAYAFAVWMVFVSITMPSSILEISTLPRLYTSDPTAGPFYSLVLILLLSIIPPTLYILHYGRRLGFSASLRQQFTIFLIATAIASTGGFYIAIASLLRLDFPILPGDAFLAIGVTMLGYAVAKYNALIEGRRVEREFLYTMFAVGSLTAFYVSITLILYLGQQISFLTLILTIAGTLSFNTLYDGVRVALDRLFYQRQFQQLRGNLRALAHEAGTGRTLSEQLQRIATSVGTAMGIRRGFIALKNEEGFVVAASHEANPVGQVFPLSTLTANEIIGLVRPERKGLEGMSLLVPLFGGSSQIGALVLGEKEDKEPYSEQDLEFLDDLAETASVIHALRVQEQNIQKISAMVADYRERGRTLELQVQQLLSERAGESKPSPTDAADDEFMKQVEDAMRHLHDFSYLGEHPLAKLRLVELGMTKQKDGSTFIERGKAVSEILTKALQKVRPHGAEPGISQIPSREWHPFIILYDSYSKDEPNRNIMARLYISEGTFNRTRRRALRSVAKALTEMEQEVLKG